jgi:F420H(2)-dependent quinone reductase
MSGEFAKSPTKWVQDQVDRIEASGGTAGTTMRGMSVVVLTVRGRKTGKLRKVPLMRVEHDGVYAAVASIGGAPSNPLWYYNILADPRIEIQDGTLRRDVVAREVHGEEKAIWWKRAVAAFGDYARYQERTSREIPVFVLE